MQLQRAMAAEAEAAREARAKVRTEAVREARAKVRTEAAREARANVVFTQQRSRAEGIYYVFL